MLRIEWFLLGAFQTLRSERVEVGKELQGSMAEREHGVAATREVYVVHCTQVDLKILE